MGVSDLALYRAISPNREWRRTWILGQRAAGVRPESALVAVLGGAWRLAPHTRLVRWAKQNHQRPGFCDFCCRGVRSGRADMAHVCLECQAPCFGPPRRLWFSRVDAAFGVSGREAAALWWNRTWPTALSSGDVDGFAAFLAAAGVPGLAAGALAALRDDLARAFASTFGVFFAGREDEIAKLPPRRR